MVKTRYMQNEPGASYMPENKGMFQPITKKKKKKKKKKKQHGVRLTYKGHRNQPESFLNGQN